MKGQLMRFRSAIIKDGEIWCVPRNLNRLFRIDLDDWFVSDVCDLELNAEYQIGDILFYQGYIYCISDRGAKIIRYSTSTGAIEHFEMDIDRRENLGIILYQGVIWIIPRILPDQLVCFDIEKNKFSIFYEWHRLCEKKGIEGKVMTFCSKDSAIYMVLQEGCEIIKFNLKESMLDKILLLKQKNFHCILGSRNEFFITSQVGRCLFRWNEITREVKEYHCEYRQEKNYIRGLKFENGILLSDGIMTDFFDMEKDKIVPYEYFPTDLNNDYGNGSLFSDIIEYNDKYILFPWNANMLLEFDRSDKKWRGHALKIPDKLFREHTIEKLEKCHLVYENEMFLDDFIGRIETGSDKKGKNKTINQSGYKIYNQIIV